MDGDESLDSLAKNKTVLERAQKAREVNKAAFNDSETDSNLGSDGGALLFFY